MVVVFIVVVVIVIVAVCGALAVKDVVAFEYAVGRCVYCGGYCS